jgi:hypothetical protein
MPWCQLFSSLSFVHLNFGRQENNSCKKHEPLHSCQHFNQYPWMACNASGRSCNYSWCASLIICNQNKLKTVWLLLCTLFAYQQGILIWSLVHWTRRLTDGCKSLYPLVYLSVGNCRNKVRYSGIACWYEMPTWTCMPVTSCYRQRDNLTSSKADLLFLGRISLKWAIVFGWSVFCRCCTHRVKDSLSMSANICRLEGVTTLSEQLFKIGYVPLWKA